MNSGRSLVIAVGSIVLWGQVASAQDLSRYRVYGLESPLDSVIAASGARATDVKTRHERPAIIQDLQWRTPYVGSAGTLPDPVRDMVFSFYNDALYQVVVNYDRARTAGLTNADIMESVSAAYGVPVPASSKAQVGLPPEALPDSLVLARWENAESVLTLVRAAYASEFQLILVSKALSARARGAIQEAIKLDAIDAPRREMEQRKKEAHDASAARDKTRETNKAAFRP